MKKPLLFLAVLLLAVTGLNAQLQFQPATIDFGQKPITSTSTLEVILTSQINQLISLSDLQAPFSASPDEFSISIGEQKTVTITFNPQTVGNFSENLTATGSVWGTAQLQIYGQSGEATVSFSNYSLDMGTILMTGQTQQMVTVWSDIAQQVTLGNLEEPFEAIPLVIDLLPGEPTQVFISFDPLLPGYYQDYLTATGAVSGYAEMLVYGSATEASIFTDPQSCNFNPLFSGETNTLEIIVTTDINQDITLTGLTDVFSVTPENLTMIAGEAQSIFISFAPVNPGDFNQMLSLSGSLWGTVYFPVSGECIDPQISVSPTQLDFGEVPLLSPTTLQITISNTGNGTLECVFSNNNPHFGLSVSTANISQNSSQTIDITFAPDFIPAEYDTLFIESNDPDSPLVEIPLVGRGMSLVSGEVCGTWYKANSPYNFTGSVTVPESCTLTIEPGVVVNMADYDFLVNGKLVCNGLENDSIYLNGTGIFQLSASCPNDSIDYVVIDGGSTDEDGLTVKSFGAKIKNAKIMAFQIINQGSTLFYDDFEDGTWEDKWMINSDNTGSVTVNANSGFNSHGMLLSAFGYGDFTIQVKTKPFLVKQDGTLNISLDCRVLDWCSGCINSTEFYWRVDNGDWNKFYTIFYTNGSWVQLFYEFSNVFQNGNQIEIMVSNFLRNYGGLHSNRSNLDNIKICMISFSPLNLYNSNLNLGTIVNYSIDNLNNHSLTINNSTIRMVDNIENFYNQSSIEINNSIIMHAGSDAIKTNGAYSNIILENVTIENVVGNGVSTWANGSKVVMNNSTIRNCTGIGIYTNSYNSPVTVTNSVIENNGSNGIRTYDSYSDINLNHTLIQNNSGSGIAFQGVGSKLIMDNSQSISNGGYGIYSSSYSSTSVVENSNISENGLTGIALENSPNNLKINGSLISKNHGVGVYGYENDFDIQNSIVCSNEYAGIYARNIYANYLSCLYNTGKGIITLSTEPSFLSNSIVCLNGQFGSQHSGNFEIYHSKTYGDPKLADSLGHLLPNSPCIDAADPTEEDARIPFGMGTVRADMGAYGGPENWIWGGEPIPTNGEPVIVHIVDLPQDQGKMVGIQYKASIFDNGHTAYDVNRYSFWRELDENGKLPIEATKIPKGQYFQKGPNYWEYVGEMPANGFANYGFSAPTLGDSTVSGMFWSKFLVVAHTNDDNIYWVSQPDSGYSVDNLAPATPLNLAGTITGTSYTLQWTPSPDEDLQYYAVYKSVNGLFGEEPFATTTEPEFADITLNLEEQDFAVAAFDFSGNRSALSPPLTTPVYDMLAIPQGWSGISSWIGPEDPSLEDLFASASDDLIILQNMQGVYWPGQNVNTLGAWDEGKGYIVKMAEEAQIPFIGHKNPENDFQLTSGWQILPVLTNCPLPVDELQNQLGTNLVMVKEIAGWRVFWPSMGISTLETLEPGKAYFLNTLTGNGQMVFGECE